MAIAGAIATYIFSAGDPKLALAAGVGTGVLLFAVYYVCYLFVMPAQLHVEQENELAKHVPVQAPKSYLGLLDYGCDVERGISVGQYDKYSGKISAEARRIGKIIETARPILEVSGTVCAKRRVAARLGKQLQDVSRRMRRLHRRYKAAAQGFAEAFTGAAPHFARSNPAEEVRSALSSAKQARETTFSLKKTLASTRGIFLEHLADKQEQLGIASEQLNFVIVDIERTTDDLVKAYDKIIRTLSREGRR